MIKYLPDRVSIVLEEIPDRVSVAVDITNCPENCPGTPRRRRRSTLKGVFPGCRMVFSSFPET